MRNQTFTSVVLYKVLRSSNGIPGIHLEAKKVPEISYTCWYKIYINFYFLPVQVCKFFFLGTIQIGDYRLYKCIQTLEALIDGRGHRVPSNKIDTSDFERHIK